MNYLAFSRKYRPQNFDEVIGQQHIAATLKNAITNNRVHHAYLFCGSRGVGKTSTARIFAKALNCSESKNGISCNKCLICQTISSGDDIDVLEIDGASNRGIEEIRNIKSDIKYLPSQAKYKIFIIDEVHMLTQAAFNALLKTLEEPPPHVKFIFATTQPYSIPDTILSRCQRFDFRKIGIEDVISRLEQVASKEKIEISHEVLVQIAQMAKGALRDSLVLLDQIYSYCGGKIELKDLQQVLGNSERHVFETLTALAQKNVNKLLEVVADFNDHGGDFSNYIDQLAQHLRDLLVLTMSGKKCIDGTDFYIQELEKLKKSFSVDYLMQAIHHTIQCKMHFQRGLLGRILLETLLLKIARIESLLPLEEMIQKLSDMEKKKIHNETEVRTFTNSIDNTRVNSSVLTNNASGDSFKNPVVPPREMAKRSQPKKAPRTALDFFQQPKKTESNFTPQQTLSKPSTSNIPKTAPQKPWEKFLFLLEQHLGRMARILKSDAKVSTKGQNIIIHLDACHKITGDMLQNKKNSPIFIKAAREAYGQAASITIDYGEQPQRNQEEQKSIVENDPLVSLCLELFGGRVIKVEEMEK